MAELVEEAVADVLGVEDVSEISADCSKDASDSTNKLCEIKIPDGVSTPEDFAEKVQEKLCEEPAEEPCDLAVEEQTRGKVC